MEILIPIIIALGVFTMVIFIRKYENEERMAMIEKGLNPKEVNKKGDSMVSLRFGLLAIGAGIGLVIGYILDEIIYMGDIAYLSMLLVFGGLGLVASHVIGQRNKLQNKPN